MYRTPFHWWGRLEQKEHTPQSTRPHAGGEGAGLPATAHGRASLLRSSMASLLQARRPCQNHSIGWGMIWLAGRAGPARSSDGEADMTSPCERGASLAARSRRQDVPAPGVNVWCDCTRAVLTLVKACRWKNRGLVGQPAAPWPGGHVTQCARRNCSRFMALGRRK
jgi:hypothetical protein